MLPDASLLPDVLPTDRLQPSGMPVPAAARRSCVASRTSATWSPSSRAVVQTFGVVAGRDLASNTLVGVRARVPADGSGHCLLNILGHEAAHRLLFPNRRAQRRRRHAGCSPTRRSRPFTATGAVHFAHHKDEMGPDEPDLALYRGYPITARLDAPQAAPRPLRHRRATKNLKGLGPGLRQRAAVGGAGASSPCRSVLLARLHRRQRPRWAYPVVWIAPWMTLWKVINRLRAIAEHGGMTRSNDRRLTTHVVRQTLPRPLLMVPVQHRLAPRPPRRHGRAVAQPARRCTPSSSRSGWVTDEIEYPTYRGAVEATRVGCARSVVKTASAS